MAEAKQDPPKEDLPAEEQPKAAPAKKAAAKKKDNSTPAQKALEEYLERAAKASGTN